MKSVRKTDLRGKRVLVGCDFNVPLDEQGNILDDFRIRATVPTIEYLSERGAKAILISHLGNPGGKRIEELSLSPVATRLVEFLEREVEFLPECAGEGVKFAVSEMQWGDIILLENLRFHKGEKENDPGFAKSLASLGDLFVQDAFGTCHRSHASIVGIPEFLPSYAGLLLEKEITSLDRLMKNIVRPFVVVIGGKKVETKTGMIERFIGGADYILVGHLAAREMRESQMLFAGAKNIIEPKDGIERDGKYLDIGPKTRELFAAKLRRAKTVLWNGPLGMIEEERFSSGTRAVAEAIIESDAFSVVGGGETVGFINRRGLVKKFSHVSTGGGAMLSYLSGDSLPGIEALK